MMMMTSTTKEEQGEEAVSFTTNWKLYDNPFFQIPSFSSQSHFHKHLVRKYSASAKHINRLHRDLKFDYPSSKINLGIDQARTQIAQLKDEVEFERKMRKKAESLNKMMARELVDQRRVREQMCDNLTKEITHLKTELEKTKTEISQKKVVKLTEKLPRNQKPQKLISNQKPFTVLSSSSCSTSSSSSNSTSMAASGKQPKRSSEPENPHIKNSQNVTFLPLWENPHIKRGIKGFVEFPRVVKAINGSISDGSKCREMGITKMECQKAQLKILLKQKSSLSSNHLVIGHRPPFERPRCGHCQKLGHEQSQCFDLISYPSHWKTNSDDKGGGRSNRGGRGYNRGREGRNGGRGGAFASHRTSLCDTSRRTDRQSRKGWYS